MTTAARPTNPTEDDSSTFGPLEADPLFSSDTDIDALSQADTDTTTLTSSVLEYVYENGRRYHAFRAGTYTMPNDEQEIERMDWNHHAWRIYMKGELHLCPFDGKGKVLELGSGSGLWAMDMGDTYPEAEIKGIDLSPIQPRWVPPNVFFEVDDIDDEWTFSTNSYDMIFLRGMQGCSRDFGKVFRQAFSTLKPGGYIELGDGEVLSIFSDTNALTPTSPVSQYFSALSRGSKASGMQALTPPELESLLREAGFINITIHRGKWPIGPWAKGERQKELGRWSLRLLREGLETYGMALFTRVLGMEREEVERLMQETRRELGEVGRLRLYWKSFVIYAQKPEKC